MLRNKKIWVVLIFVFVLFTALYLGFKETSENDGAGADKPHLPKGWYLRQIADLSNEEQFDEKTLKTISLKDENFCNNAIFYNLSYVYETGDNPAVKSDAFKVKEGRHRITFYTKPEMTLKNNEQNGFSITINIFDKDNNEIETYPPLVWNNEEIWEIDETQTRNFSFENLGSWKKITIDLDLPENSDRAVFAFSSEGVADYSGEVLLCNFSLEGVK